MSQSINRYGEFNSYDLLKFIAITAMIIDHIGMFFYPDIEILRAIGRSAYILFAFCIGYNQKYSFSLTLLVLSILMLLSSLLVIPGMPEKITFSIIPQSSVLFSIIIVRLVMQYITPELTGYKLWIITLILWCMSIPTLYLFQYGTAGIIIAICGHLAVTKKNDLSYRLFLFLNLGLYLYFEKIKWNFGSIFSYVLIIEFFILFLLLNNFNIHHIVIAKPYRKLLLFVSRNSLIIYYTHFELFKLLKLLFK